MVEPVREDGSCVWFGADPLYVAYHVPEWDSRALWEKLILDGFQAGLSWITILRKREAFRAAFEGFDPEVIAGWGEAEIERLLQDAGIIRHRGKIAATITNARAYLEIEAKEGFANYLWSYVDGRPIQNTFTRDDAIPALTPLSEQMSKDLKRAGFKFCGPTIVYAWMQATGMVNDHLVTCPRYEAVAAMGR